jgi:DNA-cytosine methyltransferase
MDYFSFFSGIGGFECGIEAEFPGSNCLGYSEIESNAMKVYESNFPEHKNLGDITKITESKLLELLENRKYLNKPVLIVGGFPCTNLSSASRVSGDSRGLKGRESCLFYELLRIMEFVSSHTEILFLLENNFSMTIANRKLITDTIAKSFPNVNMMKIDSARFGVQRRRRLFWSNYKIEDPDTMGDSMVSQTWDDVLLPVSEIQDDLLSDKVILGTFNGIFKNKQSRMKKTMKVEKNGQFWSMKMVDSEFHSRLNNCLSDIGDADQIWMPSYPIGKSRVYIGSTCHYCLIDRRVSDEDNTFVIRKFNIIEAERLFFFPDGWVNNVSISKAQKSNVLGKSICVSAVIYALSFI